MTAARITEIPTTLNRFKQHFPDANEIAKPKFDPIPPEITY